MRKLIGAIAIVIGLTGCTGAISGHQYTLSDVKKAEEAYVKIKSAYLEHKGLDASTTLVTTPSE